MSREYRKRYDPSFGFVTLALANVMRGGKKKKKKKKGKRQKRGGYCEQPWKKNCLYTGAT